MVSVVVEEEGAHYPLRPLSVRAPSSSLWEGVGTWVGNRFLSCPALGKPEGNAHASGFRLLHSRETKCSLYSLILAWLRTSMQPGTEWGDLGKEMSMVCSQSVLTLLFWWAVVQPTLHILMLRASLQGHSCRCIWSEPVLSPAVSPQGLGRLSAGLWALCCCRKLHSA